MRLQWVTPWFEGAGNTLGYARLCQDLHAALEARGVRFEAAADIALHVKPPQTFVPVPGAFNVLFTMFESPTIPEVMRGQMAEADLIVVPCQWNVPIFAQYVACPVVVCPLGLHADRFPAIERTWKPGTPFRWLHVGAPTGRKGADVLQETWARWWRGRPDAECVLKTTVADETHLPAIRRECLWSGWTEVAPSVFRHGNLTLDLRRMALAELVALYHSAHGFAFPTGGEGHGFVLHEAMATGLPALCTRVGGHLEFTNDDTVTFLDWTPRASQFHGTEGLDGLTVETAWVAPVDLSNAMDQMMRAYPRALRKARFGARQVRTFTWDRTAQTLLRHLARSTATAAA